MKLIKKSFQTMLIMMGLLAIAHQIHATEHVTMSIQNITTTNQTIEFDLFLENDGTTAIYISAFSYGINLNDKILNGGSIDCSFSINQSFQKNKQTPAFGIAAQQTPQIYQVRIVSGTLSTNDAVYLGTSSSCKVGHCILTNTEPWAENTHPMLSLHKQFQPNLTTTQVLIVSRQDKTYKVLNTMLDQVSTPLVSSPLLNSGRSAATTAPSVALDPTVSVYPNPATNQISVQLPANHKADIIRIVLTDLTGKTLLQRKSLSSDTGVIKIELPATVIDGVYFLQVMIDGQLKRVERVLIARN